MSKNPSTAPSAASTRIGQWDARAWLRNMFDRVNARQAEHGTRFTVNIGFTYEGLKAIGLSRGSLESFPDAFRAGMRGRAAAVGDVGPHAPEHWEGGLGSADIHAMGWIRTDSDAGRDEAMRILRAEMDKTGGVEVRFVQDTRACASSRAWRATRSSWTWRRRCAPTCPAGCASTRQ
jgi:hypothetical protein